RESGRLRTGPSGDAGELRVSQQRAVEPEDELQQVLEQLLLDGVALQREAHAVESVRVRQRDGDDAAAVVGSKHDGGRDLLRHADDALADDAVGVADPPAVVLQVRGLDRLLHQLGVDGRHFRADQLRRADVIVEADLVDDRKAADALRVLPEDAAAESRRFEDGYVTAFSSHLYDFRMRAPMTLNSSTAPCPLGTCWTVSYSSRSASRKDDLS